MLLRNDIAQRESDGAFSPNRGLRCALLGMKVKFLRRKRIQLCQKNLKLLGHDTLRKPELLRIFPQKVCPNLRCPQAIGANANARQCRNER